MIPQADIRDERVPPYFDGDDEPAVRPFRDDWILVEPVTYYRAHGHVTVPAGFCTDWASIPAILWPFIHPTDPRIRAASLIHDRLYESHEVSRREADFILWEAMGVVEHPASRWLRWHVWAGVRLFGAWSYATGPGRQAERRREYEAALRRSPVTAASGAPPTSP